MSALLQAIERANALASAGDTDGAATVLRASTLQGQAERDPAILLRYAKACHEWASPDTEEVALRATLALGPNLEALELLLDLLQQRLNTLKGESREAVIAECETIGSLAISLLPETEGLRWANLVHPRGLRRLELAQLGHRDRVVGARADLNGYRSWLERNESVPPDMRRTNLIAWVDIDLAELDLAEDRPEDAAERLETAIAALEGSKAPKWWIDRAYAALERAQR